MTTRNARRRNECRNQSHDPLRQMRRRIRLRPGRGVLVQGRIVQAADANRRHQLPVPEVFARHRVTAHVPRRPYAAMLRGIPTIRVFEALACGIPLVSAPWDDVEELFPKDCFLMARDCDEMRSCLQSVLWDHGLASELREKGLRAIRERHTCAHRVRELIAFYRSVRSPDTSARDTEAA